MLDEKLVQTLVTTGFNGGCFLILSYIAFFLIRNIPKWIQDHLDTMKAVAEIHKKEMDEINACFSRELAAEREIASRQVDRMYETLERHNTATMRAFEVVDHRVEALASATNMQLAAVNQVLDQALKARA